MGARKRHRSLTRVGDRHLISVNIRYIGACLSLRCVHHAAETTEDHQEARHSKSEASPVWSGPVCHVKSLSTACSWKCGRRERAAIPSSLALMGIRPLDKSTVSPIEPKGERFDTGLSRLGGSVLLPASINQAKQGGGHSRKC